MPAPPEVVAADYRFEGLPDRIVVGTLVTMRNSSEREIHELVMFDIPADVTRSAEERGHRPRRS